MGIAFEPCTAFVSAYAAPRFEAMTSHFAIPVNDIDTAGVARSFDLPLAWLTEALSDTDVSVSEPARAEVRLSRTGNEVVVRGKVTAHLVVPCARCLSDTHHPIEGELSLLLHPARNVGASHPNAAPRNVGASHPNAAPRHDHHAHASSAKTAPTATSKASASKEDVAPKKLSAKEDAGKKPPNKDGKTNGQHRRPREDDEYELSADECDLDTYDGETVVLDGFVREALLLEAPSFPLCSEDCPGIRPTSKPSRERTDVVIDPRLSALGALKSKLMLAASSKEAAPTAPEPSVKTSPAARPKLKAHRTAETIGIAGSVKKAKAKHSPNKKAK